MRVKVEDALPPAGTVTGLGWLMVTPVGATPLQPAERLTVELNPFNDERVITADSDVSGDNEISEGAGWTTELIEKSGTVTEAKTDGVPAIVTRTSDECETTPFDAVTTSV